MTKILIDRDDAELRHKTLEIAPQIELVSRADLEVNSDLISRIEVAYEGLHGDDLSRATGLKWLQTAGAGVNGLPLPELEQRGVQVTNTSGIHANCITEHLFGMLLMATRSLDLALEAQQKREWARVGSKTWSLYGKTLGVLGAGEIGGQIARVGRAFEMKIIGLSRGGTPTSEIESMFSPDQKREFFAQSDIVMNVLPLTEQTRGFMGQNEFEALPGGAIVANAGRGATIDTEALVSALQSGKVRAALLDVTEPEPLPADHILWSLPGVFITPHYSGVHPEYNAEADAIWLDNLRLYVAGESLHHLVDNAAGY